MADLSTSYMGIPMRSPIVVGASTFSRKIDNIKKAEEFGAGALVIYSLFQEQIELERIELDEELTEYSESYAEALTYFPQMEHAGPREHMMWVEKARKEVKFPIIGSLNARTMGDWIDYAKELEEAGCDGLELNLYSVETHPDVSCADIEKRALDVVEAVKGRVKIPVAVKLSPYYTALANMASKVVNAGVDGLVFFNRFYQPVIDPDDEKLKIRLDFSMPQDTRLPLRWIAILSSSLKTDFAASTGVHTGKDVARHILAGARVTQVVSSLYKNGLDHIKMLNRELSDWMDVKGYESLNEFRGKLNQAKVQDPYAFERAQYIQILLQHEP